MNAPANPPPAQLLPVEEYDGDFWSGTTGDQREQLFGILNGVQLDGDVAEIPEAMSRIISTLLPKNPDAIRSMPLSSFLSEAERVVNSDSVIRIFAACEWDELHEDGKQWVAGIVRETVASNTHFPEPTLSDAQLAEEVVSAANIVSHDGYYELDIDRVTDVLARNRAPSPERGELASLVEALRQYRNDLLYPPAADSVQRRLAMIESRIAQVQQVTSNQERKS